MLNSVAAGRRQALQVVVIQAAVTLLLALAFLVQGGSAATAALVGGLATTAGSALMGWRAFAGGTLEVTAPAQVQFALALIEAESLGRKLAVTQSGDRLTVSF